MDSGHRPLAPRTSDQRPSAALTEPRPFLSLARSADIRKLWMLRMLVRLGAGERIFLDHRLLGGLREFVLGALGLGKLGLDTESEDVCLWLLKCLDASLAAMERRKRLVWFNGTIEANLALLGSTIRLSRAERTILVLAAMLHHDGSLAIVASRTDESGNAVRQLCAVVGLRQDQVRRAIAPDGMLTRARLVSFRSGGPIAKNVDLRRGSICCLVGTRLTSLDALFAGTMTSAPDATLSRADYPYLEPHFDVIVDVLKGALRTHRPGVNVLLYGPPGTGKTELTRALAHALSAPLYEVGSLNDEGQPATAEWRLAHAATAQKLLKGRQALLAFDEIDAIFSDGSAFFGTPTTADKAKAWVNALLEGTSTPTFWIANSVYCMDAAFVRRFDVVVEMKTPPLAQRTRMLRARCEAMLDTAQIRRLAQVASITPAIMSRAVDVVRRTEVAREARAGVLETLIDNTLVAQGHKSIRRVCRNVPTRDYDPALCNASVDLSALANALADTGVGRVYLDGPPGTGKSAFGHWLAERMDKPLLLKRVSDLQSPFLGVMEQRLAEAFDHATRDGAVLQIDEVDSFLRDRAQATQSWQVSQVNEFLTQLESYEGILIASTNLAAGVDPAALRRFDFKVRLDYLRPLQVIAMLEGLGRELGLTGAIDASVRHRLARAGMAAPGDFAVVRRQHRIAPFASRNAMATALLAEVDAKRAGQPRPIGFV